MKQSRKIKPTRISVSGRIPYKGNSIQYESTLERDFLIYFTFLENVIEIVPQPVTIKFEKNNRTYPYTPDFYIEFDKSTDKKPLIVEVKPKELWQENWREWSVKWKAMLSYCKEHGYQFRIFDETRIHHLAFQNIVFLSKYFRISYKESEVELVLETVSSFSNPTIGNVIDVLSGKIEKDHLKRLLYFMMYTKKIRFDLFEPIDEKLVVCLNPKEFN